MWPRKIYPGTRKEFSELKYEKASLSAGFNLVAFVVLKIQKRIDSLA